MVLVPGVLALLPEYAGGSDPVPELRAACVAAVSWLEGPVEVVASPQGRRVAQALLEVAGSRRRSPALAARPPGSAEPSARPPEGAAARPPAAYLVVGNGSARRTEKAPGHLDPRAAAFDDELRRALLAPDPAALAGIDPGLADRLWADTGSIRRLGELLGSDATATVDLDADPFGVQYWVIRWEIPN